MRALTTAKSAVCARAATAMPAARTSLGILIEGCTVLSRVELMRTLVTGAQGCIGSWVVKRLIEQGHEVVTFDVNESLARLETISSPELVRHVDRRVGR